MSEPSAPFPGPLAAVWLTVGSWLLTGIVLGALVEPLGPMAALGFGLAVGLGGTATLAARRVPPPQAERVGLQGFAPRLLLAMLLLVPAVLLTSEIDNVVRSLLPPAPAPQPTGEAERLATGLDALQTAIVMVGIAPVVEEFFFRGVVQQGLVALGGPLRGVLGAAILYALGHGNLVTTPSGWLSATVGGLVLGLLLGGLRLASGSVLAPVLLSMSLQAVGFVAIQLEAELPIPGFNAPGDHTPLPWLAAAAGSVAAGVWLLTREGRRAPPERLTPDQLSPPRA